MDIKKLKKLYFSNKATCCKCGCTLEDNTGNGVGSVFVMDNDGKFYCCGCDAEFFEGDERIFNLDFISEIENRCRDCAYLVEDKNGNWVCDDCGKLVIDIADEDCSANQDF